MKLSIFHNSFHCSHPQSYITFTWFNDHHQVNTIFGYFNQSNDQSINELKLKCYLHYEVDTGQLSHSVRSYIWGHCTSAYKSILTSTSWKETWHLTVHWTCIWQLFGANLFTYSLFSYRLIALRFAGVILVPRTNLCQDPASRVYARVESACTYNLWHSAGTCNELHGQRHDLMGWSTPL